MSRRHWFLRGGIKRLYEKLLPGYSAAPAPRQHGSTPLRSAFNTRSARLIIGVIVLSIVIVLPAVWLWTRSGREQYQLDKLRAAVAASDYAQAQRILERLLRRSPADVDYLWTSASVEEQLDNKDKADAIRRDLAKRGHGPAVLWLVNHSYNLDDINDWSDQRHAEFTALFDSSEKWNSEIFIELNKRRAAYWTVQGQLQYAIDALTQITQWEPEASLHIASLYLRLGDHQRAEAHANLARVVLQSRIQHQPNDAVARLQLARSLMILSSETDALACLADGFERTQQPIMQQAAGEVLVSWATRLKRVEGTDETFWPRLELIHRATQCAPHDEIVVDAVLNLIHECRSGNSSRMDELREATARGIVRVAAHSLLGWLHAFNAERGPALQHLQLAMAGSPEVPTLLNNLALALMRRSDDSLEQSLTTIELADALLPNQPHFAETRGRVLMKLGRWEEAIVDLNKALTAEELRPQVYFELARALEHVGDSESVRRMETLRSQAIGSTQSQ